MKKKWEVTKIGDICKTAAGGTPLKAHKDYYEGGVIPWIRSGEVNKKEITDSKFLITEKGLRNSSAKLFPINTVLVAMYGATAGQTGILKIEASTNQAVCGILPSSNFVPEFLYYVLLNKKDELVSQAVGNAQPNISQMKIKETSVPVPSLDEQRRIVAFIDEAFEAIAKAKENVKKNLQNAMELFESYLQNVLANPRDEWKEKKLGDIFNIKHGFAFKSEFFSQTGEYVLLTPGNFFEKGGYRDRGEKQKYYVGEIPKNFILNKGDILIAMTEQAAGLLGSPIIVPESNKFLHNQRLGLIKLKENNELSTKFLFHLFNTKKIRSLIHESATGVKVRHTSPSKIMEIKAFFPPLTEQQRIVEKLEALSVETNRLEVIYQKKLNNLDELQKSILKKAVNGELYE